MKDIIKSVLANSFEMKKIAYDPNGYLEKAIGEVVTQEHGKDDLDEQDFETIKSTLEDKGVNEKNVDWEIINRVVTEHVVNKKV
jgi:hypothetical protein